MDDIREMPLRKTAAHARPSLLTAARRVITA